MMRNWRNHLLLLTYLAVITIPRLLGDGWGGWWLLPIQK
ncbi:hypothetical protein SR187_9380 [Streptococcus ruminantium]|uniref:Uncharacterized protein n=1 Tax=Streptococcus ruminantium TaxID=1917441 RepID=A0A2Z5TR38_9STRE|nr:hypothetical protein SR187_9380 [Streptococcus ruminantium]